MSNYIEIIFPSQNSDASSLSAMLKWGNRAYALYSLLLFWIIRWSFSGQVSLSAEVFTYLFFGQTAILMYVFQTYRRYFALPQNFQQKKYLYTFSGLWLIIFILYNFLQIILISFYAAEVSFSFSWIITNAIPLALGVSGEHLWRKATMGRNQLRN